MPPKSAVIFIPCWSGTHAATGVLSCPKLSGRTSTSRNFSNRCCNVDRERSAVMERRDFLKVGGGLSAYLIVGAGPLAMHAAEAETGLPVAELKAALDPKKDVLLLHGESAAAKKDVSFNKRTQIAPKLRVIAGSPAAVSSTILWAKRNGVR